MFRKNVDTFPTLIGVFAMRQASSKERINDLHTRLREIDSVSRSDRQTVDNRCRCDKAILDRHSSPVFAKTCQQFRPFHAGVRIPRKAVEAPDACIEPTFQRRSPLSLGKDKNAEAQFPENHGIDGDVRFVGAKPLHDPRVRCWFRRLAQNVGVNQIFHRVSVDSESMGTKKSLYGHASSQSIAPWFRGAARRTRR